jgi:uncharacterized membrane protein
MTVLLVLTVCILSATLSGVAFSLLFLLPRRRDGFTQRPDNQSNSVPADAKG